MKKLLLSMLIILFAQLGFSQKEILSLSFNAKDSITQNPLVLDSVYVNNTTLGCDTSLYNPVSDLSINILHVGINDPVSENFASFTVMQNVPNPFSGSTLLRIYLKIDGELNLAVYDVQGNQLSEYHNRFVKGWHLFDVSTGGSQLLFLNVSDNTSAKTIKLLSAGAGIEGSRISYNGHAGQDYPILKSVQEETGFIFYLGNQLQFIAYADGYYESILTGNPESDETYTFAMLPVVILPTVTTAPVTNIAQTTVTSGGNVTSAGGATVTTRGVCWSTSQNPTTADSHTTDNSGTGIFVSNLTGLAPNTPYYVRAYATNSEGTAYGNEVQFSTLSNASLPVVTTSAATNVTQTTATSGGNVTSDGGAPVIARGVCWSTSSNPTIAGDYTVDGSATGGYLSYLSGLTPGTQYYIRAYATNSVGTAYADELTFNTLNATLPVVTTIPAYNIAQATATSGGNVTSDGGLSVTARGVCWSTSQAPTTAESHTTDGSSIGSFVSNLTGLTPITPYYLRAYATNSLGTAYGNELTFTTLSLALPTVTTSPVSDITLTTATSGGNVTSDGGATITSRGVCWSTSLNPTITDSHTTNGSGTGVFVSNLTALAPNTPYYIRAYASNSLGTSYGDEQTFTTSFGCGDVVSYGGQNYNTVLIGTQCWFKENLNVGNMISTPAVPSNNGIIEKHCMNNDPANCAVYGGLYYWNEMMQYSMTPGVQGICPTGWHVPTDDEWGTLVGFLGGNSVAGGAMKETGTAHWNAPNEGATNSSGFTALGTGALFYGSQYSWFLIRSRLSSSTSCGVTLAAVYCYDLDSNESSIERLDSAKDNGMTVRCLKD